MSLTDKQLVEEFRIIYAEAVGRDDVTAEEAWAHLPNVIFNARADASTEKKLREKAERERDEAIAQRDVLASALRVTTSRIQMIPKHYRLGGDDDAIAYAIEAFAEMDDDQ